MEDVSVTLQLLLEEPLFEYKIKFPSDCKSNSYIPFREDIDWQLFNTVFPSTREILFAIVAEFSLANVPMEEEGKMPRFPFDCNSKVYF